LALWPVRSWTSATIDLIVARWSMRLVEEKSSLKPRTCLT
jgi:hypothetical protein